MKATRWMSRIAVVLLAGAQLGACKSDTRGNQTAAGSQGHAARPADKAPSTAASGGDRGCIEACALLEDAAVTPFTGPIGNRREDRCRKTATLISECQRDSADTTKPTTLSLTVDESILPNGNSNAAKKIDVWKQIQRGAVTPHPSIDGGLVSASKGQVQILFIQDGYLYQLVATRILGGLSDDEIAKLSQLAGTIAQRGKSSPRVTPE